MGSAAIKVIKKSSASQPAAETEKKKVKNFPKQAMNTIEHNIKGWIEELQVRKNDELLQSHAFFGGL
jgi:hypothetical protein